MPKPFPKRKRLAPSHRWTKEESIILLETVVEIVKDDPIKFEV